MLGVLVAAGRLAAATTLAAGPTNPPPAAVPEANDPLEKEYKRLMEDDDAAQAEVDEWIKDNQEASTRGAAVPTADLQRRIRDRFDPIRKAYEDFIKHNNDHPRPPAARAR